jgi:protein SCO1/2
MTKASRQLLFIVVGFAFVLTAFAAVTFAVLPGRAQLGPAAVGSTFSLTAQNGRVFSNTELTGRPYLVFFGYTHCPDFCPTALFDITAVFKELGSEKKIAALFITVDPDRDTPDVLNTYLENFDSRIIGLTGDAARIQAVAKAFKVFIMRVPSEDPDYRVDHTAAVYLMDKQGRFVSIFNLARPPSQAAKELERYL